MQNNASAGASPNDTMSASESSCKPMGDAQPSNRAANPSKKSHTAAATTSQNAVVKSPEVSNTIAAHDPHSRLPNVSRFGMVKNFIFIFL